MSLTRKPLAFIIFGATGDLAVKKIFPALSELFLEGILGENDRVIAVSRRAWSTIEFQDFLGTTGTPITNTFLSRVEYAEVEFEKNRDYKNLIKTLGNTSTQDVFCYLSLAPKFFITVIEDLRDNKILTPENGKILLEKPFGTDTVSATKLNDVLTAFLKPEQILRVDHYLGKTTVQSIMRTHETSSELRRSLSNKTVARVRVCLFETKGIEKRGGSYDGVGAFRDVGQNHMLAVLAVLMAEYPKHADIEAWQNARALVLQNLALPTTNPAHVRLGQYVGYTSEIGVPENSDTETAFNVSTTFIRGELKDVPITLAAGKRMGHAAAFIEVTFKDIPEYPKEIRFEIQPTEQIITLQRDDSITIVSLTPERDAYANIIADAIRSETRHFVGSNEAFAAWQFTDALLTQFKSTPKELYSEEKPFIS